jgi:hypothetical protein
MPRLGIRFCQEKFYQLIADREGIITGRQEVLGAWFFAKKPAFIKGGLFIR